MGFDYSCCDFCPYCPADDELDVCRECEAKAAERRLNRLFADALDEDGDPDA